MSALCAAVFNCVMPSGATADCKTLSPLHPGFVAADIISSLAFKQDYESLSIEQCSDGGYRFKENVFLQVCATKPHLRSSGAGALYVHCFEVGSLVQPAQHKASALQLMPATPAQTNHGQSGARQGGMSAYVV